MLFKEKSATAEKDDMRDKFALLAMEAGYSGTFSPYGQDCKEDEPSSEKSSKRKLELPDVNKGPDAKKDDSKHEALGDVQSGSSSKPSDVKVVRSKQNSVNNEASPNGLTPGGSKASKSSSSASTYSVDATLTALSSEVESLVTRETHFRNALVGGYEKNSVWEYVDEMDAALTGMQGNYEKQFKDLSAECARISAECSLLYDQIDEAEQKHREIEAEHSRKCESLDEELQERERRINQLDKELEDRDRTIDNQKSALEKESEFESKCVAMEELVEQLSREKDENDAALSAMKDSIDKMSAEMEASAEKCEQLESALEEAELREQGHVRDKEALRGELSDSVEAKERLESEKASLAEELDEQRRLCERARQDAEGLKGRLDAAEDASRQAERQLGDEKKRSEQLSREFALAESKNTSMAQEYSDLRKSNASLTTERDSALRNLDAANRLINGLEVEKRRLTDEINRFVSSQNKIADVLGLDGDCPSRTLYPASASQHQTVSDAHRSSLNAELSSMSAYAEAALDRMRRLNKEEGK